MSELVVVLCTVPSDEVATTIADRLVEEHLAACVKAIPGVRSTYVWEGKLERSVEVQLVIKTARARLAALEARIVELHPYEVPEVVALDVTRASGPYADWVRAATR